MADKLNIAASNIVKTTGEPPEKTFFILISKMKKTSYKPSALVANITIYGLSEAVLQRPWLIRTN
jgi:hypothetical protein